MNRLKSDGFRFGIVLGTSLVLLSLTVGVSPAWSALSRDLERRIVDRIPESRERGEVLQSADRAVESGFPEGHLAPVIEKSLDGGVPPEILTRMIDALAGAREKGLPLAPLTGKIMEGLAKRVDGQRILRAMERVSERLEYAAGLQRREAPEVGSSEALIVKGADALSAGMDREVLGKVYGVMGRERTNRKIAPEEIMDLVKTARGYGVTSREVGDVAISLMKNPRADQRDIKDYLNNLSRNAYRSGSDRQKEGPGEGRDLDGDADDEGGSDDHGESDDDAGESHDGGDDGDDGRDSEHDGGDGESHD